MGGKNSFTSMGESLMSNSGQDNFRSDGSSANRIIYPAIVRNIEDAAGYNRIQAEIVSIDEKGIVQPGKDRNTPVNKLPICIPLMSEIFHARPQIGECVLVITENPSDLTSVRYWIGPVFTNQVKLPFQSYIDAQDIYNIGSFNKQQVYSNPTINNNVKASVVFPLPNEIALQGRQDADIIFSPRAVTVVAGKFKLGTTQENTEHPCKIELIQVDTIQTNTDIKLFDKLLQDQETPFVPFSQQNFRATNINLISEEGKFRKVDTTSPEYKSNPRLIDFGEEAQTLHPVVFGDELITLLKLILIYLTTHIHTPQNPALENKISDQLKPYVTGNKLQDLISNVIRVN